MSSFFPGSIPPGYLQNTNFLTPINDPTISPSAYSLSINQIPYTVDWQSSSGIKLYKWDGSTWNDVTATEFKAYSSNDVKQLWDTFFDTTTSVFSTYSLITNSGYEKQIVERNTTFTQYLTDFVGYQLKLKASGTSLPANSTKLLTEWENYLKGAGNNIIPEKLTDPKPSLGPFGIADPLKISDTFGLSYTKRKENVFLWAIDQAYKTQNFLKAFAARSSNLIGNLNERLVSVTKIDSHLIAMNKARQEEIEKMYAAPSYISKNTTNSDEVKLLDQLAKEQQTAKQKQEVLSENKRAYIKKQRTIIQSNVDQETKKASNQNQNISTLDKLIDEIRDSYLSIDNAIL